MVGAYVAHASLRSSADPVPHVRALSNLWTAKTVADLHHYDFHHFIGHQ